MTKKRVNSKSQSKLQEDKVFDKLAEKRDTKDAKFVSHEEDWE